MSDDFTIRTVVTNTDEVRSRFLALNDAIRNRVRAAIVDQGTRLRDAAQGKAPYRQGTLAESIDFHLEETAGELRGIVGPPVFYGAILEKGVSRDVKVRLRRKSEIVGVRLRAGAGGVVMVSPKRKTLRKGGATFIRHMRIPKMPFMKPAMDMLRDRIVDSLHGAMQP